MMEQSAQRRGAWKSIAPGVLAWMSAGLLYCAAPSPAATSPCECPQMQDEPRALELAELLRAWLLPASAYDTRFGWIDLVEASKGVAWQTVGIEETPAGSSQSAQPYFKAGEAVITIDGKPTHRVLERDVRPGKWSVVLYGPRGFVETVQLSMQSNSREVDPGLIGRLADGGLSLSEYRCPQRSQPASGGHALYAVAAVGTQPAWLLYAWSCGSAGCAIDLQLIHSRNAADAVRC